MTARGHVGLAEAGIFKGEGVVEVAICGSIIQYPKPALDDTSHNLTRTRYRANSLGFSYLLPQLREHCRQRKQPQHAEGIVQKHPYRN